MTSRISKSIEIISFNKKLQLAMKHGLLLFLVSYYNYFYYICLFYNYSVKYKPRSLLKIRSVKNLTLLLHLFYSSDTIEACEEFIRMRPRSIRYAKAKTFEKPKIVEAIDLCDDEQDPGIDAKAMANMSNEALDLGNITDSSSTSNGGEENDTTAPDVEVKSI